MNRSTRTLVVVGIAVVAASLASFLVYRTIKQLPVREVEVAHTFAVVAARPLSLGTRIAKSDLKLVAWPDSSPVPGGFSSIEAVVDRGIILPVAENEPLTNNNIASAEAGAGLPPTIPPGMRAISVRVNEVIGVAGFVVPGTRVDVMVILRQGTESIARVVVTNVQVLTAGTRYDQAVAKEGTAIPSSVVTLMVTPGDAERVGLAAVEGQLMLTLRNPLDTALTESTGTRTAVLVGQPVHEPSAAPVRRVVVATPPPPPPEPKIYTVETIRAAKRAEEPVR